MLHVFNKIQKRMNEGPVIYMSAWERKYNRYIKILKRAPSFHYTAGIMQFNRHYKTTYHSTYYLS